MKDVPGTIEEKIVAFFSKYPKRTYPKGNILLFAGEQPACVYYISTGKVVQYDISYRGDEIIVNIFKPGAFFSMAWVLNGSENRFFYKAELATTVYCAPKNDVLAFIKHNQDATLDLLSRVYKGLDGILARAVSLRAGAAKERIIHELILESRRFGHAQKDGSVVLDIGEKELAARAGLARETVSRELSGLKVKGIVTVGSRGITVCEPEALVGMLAAHP